MTMRAGFALSVLFCLVLQTMQAIALHRGHNRHPNLLSPTRSSCVHVGIRVRPIRIMIASNSDYKLVQFGRKRAPQGICGNSRFGTD